MLLNTGFTYKNTKGTYTIRTQPDTAADYYYVKGKKKSDQIIAATYEYGLNTVYANSNASEESVALRFAGINIHKDKEIIDFCNAYGLIYVNEIDADENNDYLFMNAEKDSVQKPLSDIGGGCLFLDDFRREIIRMRKILTLYDALNTKNLKTVIEVLSWFCFDNYEEFDDEELQPAFESQRFNNAFREFVANEEASEISEEYKTLSDTIRLFLKEVEDDHHQAEMAPNSDGIRMYSIEYPDMYHTTWQALHSLFIKLLNIVDITSIGPLGDVIFSRELSEEDVLEICPNSDYSFKLGKAFLSDCFNTELMWVHPEMTFENGQFLPNLRISSLMQAMYVELFFKITPYTNLRKCANPTCNAFFEVSRDNSKKMYCGTRCAQLMAKRKQRERERDQ